MKMIKILISALLFGLLAACGSNEPKPYVEFENSEMEDYIEVGELLTRKKGDMLQVAVELKNDAKKPVRFQYKFRFYDADGFEVGSERPWTRDVLSSKETKKVQATAPNPTALGAKIHIKK